MTWFEILKMTLYNNWARLRREDDGYHTYLYSNIGENENRCRLSSCWGGWKSSSVESIYFGSLVEERVLSDKKTEARLQSSTGWLVETHSSIAPRKWVQSKVGLLCPSFGPGNQ
jgi:hypothetical protein